MNFFKSVVLTAAFLSGAAFSMGSRAPSGETPNSESGRWQSMIRQHGGRVVSASRYSNNSSGFNSFLRDSGVRVYDADDLIVPYNSSAARSCGLSVLLPSQSEWVRGAALAMWVQKMSSVAGEVPRLRNWYRPTCYNSKVGGASRSDHIQARAFDVDFRSRTAKRKAQDWLCGFWRSSLNMQIGLGGLSIHVGAESPYGKRNWYYGSYSDSDEGRTCFDR